MDSNMDNTQNNNQFPNTSPIQNPNPAEVSNQKSIKVFAVLAVVILGLMVATSFWFVFTQKSVPASLGVDKDGVLIIEMNRKQVTNRTADGKPLNEPEVRAVFRWAVEHPDEAARLSAEEKANIIRALNE